MASLRNMVALITGASSGIGQATAKHFASLGCYLALSGRNRVKLQRVGQECEANGIPNDKILLLQGDVTNEDFCKSAVEKTVDKFGQLDVLVNNAGIADKGSIETTSLEQYDIIMNTNVRAAFHVTSLAVPHLIKTKGAIVNVSSVNGMSASPGILAYNISKAAIDQFTNSIALELAPKQVRVNSVNPGVILTPIHENRGLTDEQYTKFLKEVKTTVGLGRAGKAEEVAKAIAFLASDDSSYITGTQMLIDGGSP
ncbi:3-oxoacyl-[acyl-carrier-protein] reductase FabG-like [Glandiceps talaboti]